MCKAIQTEGVTYAGGDYYDRMAGAVMTNQYFTPPAMDVIKKLKILFRNLICCLVPESRRDLFLTQIYGSVSG